MIDEDRTLQLYGYTSDSLTKGSHKLIVRVCDECGRYKIIRNDSYKDLCHTCCQIGIQLGNKHWNYGKHWSKEVKDKMSKSSEGKIISDKTKEKISKTSSGSNNGMYGKKHTDEAKIKSSCTKQDIEINEFDGFLTKQKYCEKFNFKLKEQIRNKYNRKCFICGKPEFENLNKNDKIHNLSVHHINRDKMQGCDSEWKLIPVCMSCHPKLH